MPNRKAPAKNRFGRAKNHLRRALPSPRTALAGALLWALAMAASAVLNLLLDDWATPVKIRAVALLFAAGGLLAFPIGLLLARILSQDRRVEAAFAAAFVCLIVSTIAFTSGLYALQYRTYYAAWHAPAFTRLWANEYVFTIAAGIYQFFVLGIRLYFPVGFVALFAASLWFARRR